MSRKSINQGFIIPVSPFGYYCTIFNIDFEELSNVTGIPVNILEYFRDKGLSSSSIGERVAISNALGIALSDISEEKQKGKRIKPEW